MSVTITEHEDGQLSVAFGHNPVGRMNAQQVTDAFMGMLDDNRRVLLALVKAHNRAVSK